jgi:hypothetical protein
MPKSSIKVVTQCAVKTGVMIGEMIDAIDCHEYDKLIVIEWNKFSWLIMLLNEVVEM